MVEKIPVLDSRLPENILKQISYVICTDDATIPPDLDHFGEVDAPSVLLVCLVNNVDALDEGCKERGVYCFAEVF